MSILAMIAAMQTHGAPPAPPVDPRPAPLDATVAAMRPTGRLVFSATVAQDGTGDYTTIQAAVDAAKAAQAARMAAEGAKAATPNHAVRILVRPGTYREAVHIGAVPWVQVYGAGRGKTTILPPATGAHRGVLEATGRLYVEGLTLRRDQIDAGGTNPVYPVHTNNFGTSVWVDVHFDNAVTPTGYGYGSDGSEDASTTLYRCTITGGVNAHGWASNTRPQAIAFIGCQVSERVGWEAMSDVAPDEVWVVGGSSGSVRATGAATRLHLDPAHTTGTVTAAGPRDSRTDWPVPTGGLSATDRDLYGM